MCNKCLNCNVNIDTKLKYCSVKCRENYWNTQQKLNRHVKTIELVLPSQTLCDYNCGRSAVHCNKSGKFVCETSSVRCPVIKAKNTKDLKLAYDKGIRKSGAENYKNLPQDKKDAMNWNKGLTAKTNTSVKQYTESRRKNYENGLFTLPLTGFAADRTLAYRNIHKYIDSFGNECELESNLELQTAKLLDKYNLRWKRCIEWLTLTSTNQKYTSDFYLVDYQIYLDPKWKPDPNNNRYNTVVNQLDKISKLCNEHNYDIRVLFSRSNIIQESDFCDLLKDIIK